MKELERCVYRELGVRAFGFDLNVEFLCVIRGSGALYYFLAFCYFLVFFPYFDYDWCCRH